MLKDGKVIERLDDISIPKGSIKNSNGDFVFIVKHEFQFQYGSIKRIVLIIHHVVLVLISIT